MPSHQTHIHPKPSVNPVPNFAEYTLCNAMPCPGISNNNNNNKQQERIRDILGKREGGDTPISPGPTDRPTSRLFERPNPWAAQPVSAPQETAILT